MTQDILMFELKEYEERMKMLWEYWDDVMRSWKMLERGRMIRELQAAQIREFKK